MAKYKRIKNTQADVPDSRDWIYQSALINIAEFIDPVVHTRRNILDQKSEGACTGFAVAAVINILNQRAGRDIAVSARMLYEMAKRNDEWPGESYDGSSLRGSINGWKNMGVCEEALWPYLIGTKKGRVLLSKWQRMRVAIPLVRIIVSCRTSVIFMRHLTKLVLSQSRQKYTKAGTMPRAVL